MPPATIACGAYGAAVAAAGAGSPRGAGSGGNGALPWAAAGAAARIRTAADRRHRARGMTMPPILPAHGEEGAIRAEEDPPAGDRRRRQEALAEVVGRQHLRRAARLEHERLAGFADEVDLAVAGDRRGEEHRAEA